MLWIYRLVSVFLIVEGLLFIINDIPPRGPGSLTGLGLLVGLSFMVVPGTVNLLSSFMGNDRRRVQWGAVFLSIFVLVVWISFSVIEALQLHGRPTENPEYLLKILVAGSLIALIGLGGRRVIGEEEKKLKATA